MFSLHIGQAFLDLGELLISTDAGAALDAFKTVKASLLFSNFMTASKLFFVSCSGRQLLSGSAIFPVIE